MNYYSIFYWVTVSDGIKEVFDSFSNIFTFFSIVAFGVYIILIGYVTFEELDERNKNNAIKWRNFFSRTFWIAISLSFITWLGWVAVPSKKDCMMIIAGGAVGNFITSDSSAKEIPSDVAKFLHESLKNQIKELNADVKKEFSTPSPKDQFIDKAKEMTKEQLIEYLKSDTTFSK